MKIAQYNDMMSYLTRPEFSGGSGKKPTTIEELKKENTMIFDGKEYQKNRIYEGSDFNELKEAVSKSFSPKDFIGPVKQMAGGGLAYLMGM